MALPLTQSSMYHLPGRPDGLATYGRVDNPTWVHLEHVLSHLEDAPCLSFPSGMAAISAALFATVQAGSRHADPVGRLLRHAPVGRTGSCPGLGVVVEERPTTTFTEGGFDGFDVVFVESPSNPGLDMIDLAGCRANRCAPRAG